MKTKEKILIENLKEYIELAEYAYKHKKYNTAATLFFKAICAAIDLFIFQKQKIVPSSHTSRFKIVKEHYPEIYSLLDKDFPFYQNSYTQKLNKEAVEILREDANRIKQKTEN